MYHLLPTFTGGRGSHRDASAIHRALRLSGDFIHGTFVVQARIVRDVAGRLLDLAFERFGLALQFIAIHGEPLTS